jgi:protoheme IX farnesyltransferase
MIAKPITTRSTSLFSMSLANEGADSSRRVPAGTIATILARAAEYLALTKPRVMSLVVFTAAVVLVVTPGHVDPMVGFGAILCIAIGAGAAGALNMWYDADVDALMSGTAERPIPGGRVSRREALAFGVITAAASVAGLAAVANVAAASLLAFTIFFYVVVYTMRLKRLTPQSIVIGGAAGAAPPAIAWTAATGQPTWRRATNYVSHHLPVDPSPFLGVGDQSDGRL